MCVCERECVCVYSVRVKEGDREGYTSCVCDREKCTVCIYNTMYIKLCVCE